MSNITRYVVLASVRNEEGEGELITEPPAQKRAYSCNIPNSVARSLTWV